MKWFVEEKGFRGNWCPAIYYSKEPPSEKRTEGARKVFRNPPKAIAVEHFDLPFKEICHIYSEDAPKRRLQLSFQGPW
jgi:hypothetical protein